VQALQAERVSHQSGSVLSLHEYAETVSLSVPFRRVEQLGAFERTAVVTDLVDYLLQEERGQKRPPKGTEPAGDGRALLRGLLTVRPPRPLTDEFHASLDAVLEGELRDRGVVDSASLNRLDTEGDSGLALWRGDITTLRVDAIVNAANSALLGCFRPMHPCIDNAIHCGAGPRLREDCATIIAMQGHEEPTGCAKATRAYDLPSRYILHTVGPIAQGVHNRANADALAQSYEACLDCARELAEVRTIAFCGLSTGVFGYPKEPACRIAVETVRRWIRAHPRSCDLIVFNVFSHEDHAFYERVLTSSDVNGAAG
jgi:O-acetyl-ADP-ribose deacetylase (regulator of RNase III)